MADAVNQEQEKEKALQVKGRDIVADAKKLKVTDLQTMNLATITVKGIDALVKEIEEAFDPQIEHFQEIKRSAEQGRKEAAIKKEQYVAGPIEARRYLLKQIGDFREEENRRREKEAAAEQERLRKAEEDRKLQEATDLEQEAKRLGNFSEVTKEHLSIGLPVYYHEIIGGSITKISRIASDVWELGDGTPVVKINGIAGGVSLKALSLTPEAIQIVKSMAEGKIRQAEEVISEPVITPVIQPQKIKTEGIVSRPTWKFKVTNIKAFLQAIIDGKIDIDYALVNEVKVGQFTRMTKKAGEILPGITAYEERSDFMR